MTNNITIITYHYVREIKNSKFFNIKGLEFDDVLLYNFFSDSPAEDLWRAVSSYSEADIAAYYGKLW